MVSVGFSDTAVVYPAKGEVMVQKMNGTVVHTSCTGRGFAENFFLYFPAPRENIKCERLGLAFYERHSLLQVVV